MLSNPVNALPGDLDSATCTIKNDDPLSPQAQTNIHAITNNATIKLFPNPVKDELNIAGLNSFHSMISIIDLRGKTLLETPANNQTNRINIRQLSAGVYYLKIETTEKIVVLKFVKQ